jgi:GNAT superfamily N-acetyltransferase
MRNDPHHWVAGSSVNGKMVGIVTLTTMPYVEWGRLGEIGDLYVLPVFRMKGIARALIEAAIHCAVPTAALPLR